MVLLEFFQDVPAGYSKESDDNTVLQKSDTRKTRLTLADLNKIRMVNDVRKFEKEQELQDVSRQYAAPAPGAEGAPSL
jgi:hypothetical protein